MKEAYQLPLPIDGDVADLGFFGRGKYKFWLLFAIVLLAFWSLFTGTVTLHWSAGDLNSLAGDVPLPMYDDIDVLEMEEREKVVRHMWEVYTQSQRNQLPRFWQAAFEAAYEDLASEDSAVREAAISEIAKMSVQILDLETPQQIPKGSVEMNKLDAGRTKKKSSPEE
ncbi:polyol transporter, putative (DUF1195) [Wolffia australiana]